MKLKQTTALKKIGAIKSRIWGLQGGQGAGKTISVLWLIANHAFLTNDREIVIASGEVSKMKTSAIKDFKKVLMALGYWNHGRWNGSENQFTYNNGSWVKFVGLDDKEDFGKGARTHITYFNEANKIKSFEAYRQLSSRADRVIIDFNPDTYFWYHKEVMDRDDCTHLILTFLDNEFLGQSERNEILGYKEKGFGPNGEVINEYWANKWRVYGLGEIGGVEGRIFYWKKCSYHDFLAVPTKEIYIVDWGTVDPFAIMAMKYDDGIMWLDELNYDSENKIRARLTPTELRQMDGEDEGLVTWLFKELAIPKNRTSVCDNNREAKRVALMRKGWTRIIPTKKWKGSILDGIDLLQNIDVRYTDRSENIEMEQLKYKWAVDKNGNRLEEPEDANNHHMDNARYGALYLLEKGKISRV